MFSKDELLGILKAYELVHDNSWPTLNPTLAERATRWSTMQASELESELAARRRGLRHLRITGDRG